VTNYLTLDDMALNGKTVLVRADLNVPMQNGIVSDASRIERLIPTLNSSSLRMQGRRAVTFWPP